MGFSSPAPEMAVPKLPAYCLRDRKTSHHNHKCYGCGDHCSDCTTKRRAKTKPAALQPPSNPPAHPDSSLKFTIAKYTDPSKTGNFEIIKPNSSSANAAAEHCADSIPPATGPSGIQKDRKRKSGSATDEKRPEFLLSLSKKEISDDFLAMTGTKPSRRPAKRPKLIQKQLNEIFPGVNLSKRVTEAQYNVRRSDMP